MVDTTHYEGTAWDDVISDFMANIMIEPMRGLIVNQRNKMIVEII